MTIGSFLQEDFKLDFTGTVINPGDPGWVSPVNGNELVDNVTIDPAEVARVGA